MGDRNPKYKSQYKLYDWYKQHGICVECRREFACDGLVRCPECLEKDCERNKKYVAAHHEEHKKYCKEYRKRIYEERKSKGLCTRCGKKAIEGQTLCLSCKLRNKKARQKSGIERSMRPSFGLCYRCGNPLNNYEKLCDYCHDRQSNQMKELSANPTEAMLRVREEYVLRFRQFKRSMWVESMEQKNT